MINYALSMHKSFKVVKTFNQCNFKKMTQWQLSPHGTVKFNVSEATFHEENSTRVGLILRDCKGKVLMSISKKEQVVMESFGD